MMAMRKISWVLIVAPVKPMGASTHADMTRAELQGPATETRARELLHAIMESEEYQADHIRAWMRPLESLDYPADTAGRVSSLVWGDRPKPSGLMLVVHQNDAQRIPRVSAMRLIQDDGGDELVFDARPTAGTQTIRRADIISMEPTAETTPFVGRVFR